MTRRAASEVQSVTKSVRLPDGAAAARGDGGISGERVGDRVLRISAALTIAAVLLVPVHRVMASEQAEGFEALRTALDRQLGVRGKGVPMMWAVSLFARGFTSGGVRDLRVVEWEGLRDGTGGVDRAVLERTVRERLGAAWSPMVRDRSAHGSSLVYVQPAGHDGKRMRLVVLDVSDGEADLVSMELSPDALSRWEQQGH